MSAPDPFPTNADIVIVQHHWWDANTRRGVTADVTWTPISSSSDPTAPNLVDASAHGWVKTRSWTSRPHRFSGYMAVPLTATNDPDLASVSGFGGYRVQAAGEAPFTILVDAATPKIPATLEMSQALAQLDPPVSLEVNTQVRAVWLTDLAVTDPPAPPSLYFTATQTTNLVLDTVSAHDADAQAHPAIRALIGQGGVADATTGSKGKARLLGGTADAPLVPWSAVTGAPTSYPPSGGAGGVLSGTFPNPGFSSDMAYQSELDAVSAAAEKLASKGQPNGYADLGSDGKVPQSRLPAIAVTDYLGAVASQPAMLALVGQRGDWCYRSDTGTDWQLVAEPSSSLASWQERHYPASPVSSVNGRVGAVSGLAEAADLTAHTSSTANPHAVTKAQVGLGSVANTAPADLPVSTATQSALDALSAGVPEQARDALGAALVAGTNISIVPNDAADTITISATAASGTTVPTRTTSASTTAVPGELLIVDASGGQRTVTPPASPAAGTFVTVLKTDSSANYVVWDGATNSDTSAGLVKQWSGARFTWLGSVWAVTATNPVSVGSNDRADHFGTEPISAVSGLQAALDGKSTPLTQRATAVTAASSAGDKTAAANEIVPLDTSGGTFTLTGPTGGGVFGARWKAGTAAPTIAAPSGYTIAGAASITMGLAPASSSGELVIWQPVGTDYQPVGGFKPQTALSLRHGDIRNTHLLAWAYAQAFRLSSATRDANSAISTASVVWPDGSTGTFTTTTASTAFPGAIDAYTVTYVPTSGSTLTVTQTAVTRDANGAVTAQPALAVT